MQIIKLTPKQKHWTQVYLETGNATEAYRRAYNAENMMPNTINRAAKAVADNSKVQAYLSTLSEAVEKKVVLAVANTIIYDRAAAMAEAKQAFDVSLSKGNGPGMVAATQLRAKLNGLIVEKAEIKTTAIDELSDEDSLAVLNALTAISKARQLTLIDATHRN